jgi:K+ transporter
MGQLDIPYADYGHMGEIPKQESDWKIALQTVRISLGYAGQQTQIMGVSNAYKAQALSVFLSIETFCRYFEAIY